MLFVFFKSKSHSVSNNFPNDFLALRNSPIRLIKPISLIGLTGRLLNYAFGFE